MRVRINRKGHIRDGALTWLAGRASNNAKVYVLADHRPAANIIDALRAGESVTVDPEPYQVLRRA